MTANENKPVARISKDHSLQAAANIPTVGHGVPCLTGGLMALQIFGPSAGNPLRPASYVGSSPPYYICMSNVGGFSNQATQSPQPSQSTKEDVAKANAISRLGALVDEYTTGGTVSIPSYAVLMAEGFLRALPDGISLPEFSVEPDGSISMEWIQSRNRIFSVSVGTVNRFAFAWLDGINKGHGVENFDGEQIPKRIMDGISSIVNNGNASFRAA
jgi:hypothetical protein